MRAYELMYIIRPDLDEEATKAVVERFQNVIEEQGGQVDNLEEKGKRRLAYEIDDLNEGYYVIVNFTADPQTVGELERQLGLAENIMRHLVIKEEE